MSASKPLCLPAVAVGAPGEGITPLASHGIILSLPTNGPVHAIEENVEADEGDWLSFPRVPRHNRYGKNEGARGNPRRRPVLINTSSATQMLAMPIAIPPINVPSILQTRRMMIRRELCGALGLAVRWERKANMSTDYAYKQFHRRQTEGPSTQEDIFGDNPKKDEWWQELDPLDYHSRGW